LAHVMLNLTTIKYREQLFITSEWRKLNAFPKSVYRFFHNICYLPFDLEADCRPFIY
jgi:hypothetical protein